MNKLRSKNGIVVYKEMGDIYEELVGLFFIIIVQGVW